MPRIRCRYVDCVFLENGYCGAAAVEIDPDEGCLTYSHVDDVPADEEWDEEDMEELWEENLVALALAAEPSLLEKVTVPA